MTAENCGAHFNLDYYLNARLKTIQAVQNAAQNIRPGMTEPQAILILNQELELLGIEKFWHPTKLRINSNTIKNFRESSEDNVILLENDIYFIDIGPVFSNHEGDYGETFIFGDNPKILNLKDSTKVIFQATQEAWKLKKLSGIELYQFAENEARKHKLKLNSNMYGHRLGDFPHALHYKGKLGNLNSPPSSMLWVLEIHLIDESINRGAFFEDILI